MSLKLIKAWSNFAHGGEPGWAPFEGTNRTALVLGETTAEPARLVDTSARACVEVWDACGYVH